MAEADIDGFRIRIDDTLARDIKAVDKALQGIEQHGEAAGKALDHFNKSLFQLNGIGSTASEVAQAFNQIKESIKGMPSKTLETMATNLGSIKKEINGIDETKLSRAFSSAKTPASGIVEQITEAVNRLAQLSEGMRSMMTQASKPIQIQTTDESTKVKTTQTSNEQHSLEQINATLKQREQEMQRLISLQDQLTKKKQEELEQEQKIQNLQSQRSAAYAGLRQAQTEFDDAKRKLEEIHKLEQKYESIREQKGGGYFWQLSKQAQAEDHMIDKRMDALVREQRQLIQNAKLSEYVNKHTAEQAFGGRNADAKSYFSRQYEWMRLNMMNETKPSEKGEEYKVWLREIQYLKEKLSKQDNKLSKGEKAWMEEQISILTRLSEKYKTFGTEVESACKRYKELEEAQHKAFTEMRTAQKGISPAETAQLQAEQKMLAEKQKIAELDEKLAAAGAGYKDRAYERLIIEENLEKEKKAQIEAEQRRTAELERQKNIIQSEAKGTPTSGQVDVSVKFNEQSLLAAIKDIATKLETLFKDIPVSLKKELDLTFFQQKAEELKKMFAAIAVPVTVTAASTSKPDNSASQSKQQPVTDIKIEPKTVEQIKDRVYELAVACYVLMENIEKVGNKSNPVFDKMHNSLMVVIDDIASLQANLNGISMKNVKTPKVQTVLPNDEYFVSANKLQEINAAYKKATDELARLEEELRKVKAAEEAAASGSLRGKLESMVNSLTESGEKRTSSVIQEEIDGVRRLISALEEENRVVRASMEEQIKKGNVVSSTSQTVQTATERNIAGLRAEIKEQKEALREGAGITQEEGKQQAAVDALARSKAELKAQEMSLIEQLKQQYQELLKLDKIYDKLAARETLNSRTGGKSGDLTSQEIELQTKINEEIAKREALIKANTALSTQEGQALRANYDLELLRIRAENDRWVAEQQKRYENKPSTTTKKKDTTEADLEKEILALMKEKLKLTEKQRSLEQKSNVKGGVSQEEVNLYNAIVDRLKVVDNELSQLASKYTSIYNTAEQKTYLDGLEMEVRLRKELDALLKASNKTEKSPEEIRIENLVKEYKSVLSQMQTIEKAQAQANKTLNDKNATQDEKDRANKILADTTQVYEQLAQRRVEIEQETDDKIVALRNKAAATMAKAEAQRLKQEQKDREQKAQIDPKAAVEYAKNAKTINDLQTALKNLKKVMGDTVPNSGDWKRLNITYKETQERLERIQKAMQNTKSESSKLLPTLRDVAMQFGIMFSVQQIGQWVKHMTEVRAQFELQQIALRSIIQDKQKADEVFAQVQQLALKSPFSIMQLNTYTKQIAAYGVEADKLVGTTKELADVSAGLGVDMGRLILAYGQVKTANYLRATEVRQFTEAGLNITQELANYFTELNGKMVTAGEVTEMITKRMVKFEDVAEVFHRVTSAGGMFYDMQEKQAEGLHGQMQRIGDAYAMMLNDIGKSNEGIIVEFLSTVRTLIQNWRAVAPAIEAAAAAFAAFYAAKGLGALWGLLKNVWAGLTLVVAEMKAATGALAAFRAGLASTNLLMGTMGWVGLALAIGGVVYAMTQASKSVSQLEEDLERMRREIIVDVADSIGRFRELADVIKDPTASFEQQKEALDELRRAYGDILPSEMLEIENIRKMGGEYAQATEAIREYYRTKLEEEQKSRIEADAATMFSSASKDAVEKATEELKKFGASKSTVQKIMNSVIEQAKTGAIKGAKGIAQAFENALGKYYNTNVTLDNSLFDMLAGAVTAYQNELASLTSTVIEFETHEEELEHQVMRQTSKAFDVQKEKVENLISALKELYNLRVRQDRVVEQGGVLGSTDNIQMATAIATVNKAYAELGDTTGRTDAQIMSLVQSTYNLDTEISRVTHTIYDSFIKGLSDTKAEADALAKNKYLQTWIQGLQREIDAVDGTPVQKEIRKIEKSLSELYHVDLGTFDWLKTDIKTSFSSAAKEVKGKIDEIKEQVLQFKTIAGMSIFPDPTKHAEEVTGMTKEEYDRASKTIEMYTKLWNSLGGHDKEKKTKGTDKTEQTLRERIQLLKEANQTYEKYAKEYDKVIAKEKTHNDLMERAKELNIAEIFKAEDLTNTGTLDAMQKVYNKFKSLYENKKYVGAKRDAMKEMSEMKFEFAVELNKTNREELQRELDKMMGGYQLYVELDKTGVDTDIIKQLFNIDYTSLDDIQARWEQLYLEKINEDYKQIKEGFEGFKTYEEAKQKLSQEKDNENYKRAIDAEKKITEAMHKEYESRMKEYMKYLKKSYGDAVNVQVEAYDKMRGMLAASNMEISLVQSNKELTPKQKEQMIAAIKSQSQRITEAIREEMQKSLNEVQWKQFKENPIFEKMFTDLDKVGEATISTLLNRIKEIKDALSDVGSEASTKLIREMAQYEEKLYAAKVDKHPFREYINALKEVRKLQKEGESYKSLNETLAVQTTELSRIDASIEKYQMIVSLKDKQNSEAVKGMKLTEEQTELLKKPTVELNATISKLKQEKAAQEDVVNTTKKKVKTYENALTAQEKTVKKWQQYGDVTNQIFGSLRAGLDAFNHDADAKAVIEPYLEGFEQVGQAVIQIGILVASLGPAINSTLGIIGIIATAVSAIFSMFSAFGKAHDAALENQIKADQRAVDRLKRAFDDLSEAIDNAFTGVQLGASTKESIQNLKEQNRYYSQMIAAERDKKDSDQDKIIGWQNQIEDNIKEMKKLQEKYINELGGIATGADVLSAAQDFVDAWADAFGETGRGLSGLQDNFDDFMRNILKKQAYMKVADHWIDNFGEMINKAFDQYGQVDYDKLTEAMDYFTGVAIPQIDAFLTDFNKATEAWGGIAGGNDSKLSGLAAGIQGVTEETAQIVEAMLNSIRYFVADTNASVKGLYNTLINPPQDNVFLAELKAQTAQLTMLNKTLSSLVKAGHKNGGSGLKVFA